MSSFDRLRKAGVEPAVCLDHGLTISLYYKDPEGNFVELQSDNFSDWKLSPEWMRTSPDFAANPIGTFFYPARVYEKFQSGADFKALQRSARAPTCRTRFPTSACQRRNDETGGCRGVSNRLPFKAGCRIILAVGASVFPVLNRR
jgi:hypothetical protein